MLHDNERCECARKTHVQSPSKLRRNREGHELRASTLVCDEFFCFVLSAVQKPCHFMRIATHGSRACARDFGVSTVPITQRACDSHPRSRGERDAPGQALCEVSRRSLISPLSGESPLKIVHTVFGEKWRQHGKLMAQSTARMPRHIQSPSAAAALGPRQIQHALHIRFRNVQL